MRTDREVLELCKSWFDDIVEKSGRLITGNVSHCGRAIHGVAMNYAKYVDEHLHNSNRERPVAWNEDDERICQCIIEDQKEAFDKVNNSKYGHSEIISDLKEMYRERINWLESIKSKIQRKQ